MEKIENALLNYAGNYTPPGSLVKSVIHQWIHAIIYNNRLFAEGRGASKREIIQILKKANIYKNKEQFSRPS